jgi:heat shock protein HslJ
VKESDKNPVIDSDFRFQQITAIFLAVKGFIMYTPVPHNCMQPKERNSHHLLPLLGGTVILITLIIAAGCTGQLPQSEVNGTSWTLTGYVLNGTIVPVPAGTGVTLDFGDDGRVSGSAGCNRFFAKYDVKGTTITLGPAGSTMMYCGQPGVMEQESAFLVLLNQARTFRLDADRLSLFDAKGVKILSFAKTIPPVPKPLVGTNWTLESVHTANVSSSGSSDTTITAIFENDGQISGSSGCNRYFARYNLTGASLSVGQAGSTQMMCGNPDVMTRENTYLGLLKNIRDYTIEGHQLILTDETGGRILIFSANP